MLLVFTAAPVFAAFPASADDAGKEYAVKAAFLYNFVKFTEWPGALASAKKGQGDVNICVIGANPFTQQAQQVFRQASSSGIKLSLSSRTMATLDGCHVVFVSSSEASKLNEIMTALKETPVLTVSDIEGFAQKGGIIGFTNQDGKVKLVVNAAAARTAGLHIDAQLLEIAVSVIRS